MLLFYIRHGDPIYAPDQLTALGRRQAEAAGRRLALYGIDKIFSSTSTRAYQTALPTAEILKKDITQLDWAHEDRAWADLTVPTANGGKTWCFYDKKIAKLFAGKEMRALGDKWYEHPELQQYDRFKPGMERIDREVDAFLASLGYEHDREKGIYNIKNHNHDRVALFAHEGFGRAFLSSVLDIPFPEATLRFCMTHSAVSVIGFDDEGGYSVPRLLTLSNDSHIYADGLPTNYYNRIRF